MSSTVIGTTIGSGTYYPLGPLVTQRHRSVADMLPRTYPDRLIVWLYVAYGRPLERVSRWLDIEREGLVTRLRTWIIRNDIRTPDGLTRATVAGIRSPRYPPLSPELRRELLLWRGQLREKREREERRRQQDELRARRYAAWAAMRWDDEQRLAARNAAIVRWCEARVRHDEIAARLKISKGRVSQIWLRHKERSAEPDDEVLPVLSAHEARLLGVMADRLLRLLAERREERDAFVVGRRDALRQSAALLEAWPG